MSLTFFTAFRTPIHQCIKHQAMSEARPREGRRTLAHVVLALVTELDSLPDTGGSTGGDLLTEATCPLAPTLLNEASIGDMDSPFSV